MRIVLFLTIATLGGYFFSCSSKGSSSHSPEGSLRSDRKPNIIFLLTDDHRWDALGAMGNRVIQTPHLDRLAQDGMMFKNAYVTTAICMVSRASILSGQYKSSHQIDLFRTSFTAEAFRYTYPALLREAGYHTGFIGKFGVGEPRDQPKASFDFWAGSAKGQPDYEMVDANGNYLHHTDKVWQDVSEFLDQVDEGKPFNLSVSFKAPHVQDGDPRQFIINPRYKSLYADDVIPVPELADPKYWNSFPDFFRTEKNIARERWHLRFETPEMYQESVKNYYRLITGVDDVVGNMMKKLEEKGMANNTVVIFTGDNGFYLGERGLAGKWYGHEESIRVPLIIYDPRNGGVPKGVASEKIALNIDIAPTILSLAGLSAPASMQGVDLIEMVSENPSPLDRSDFFYEHTFLGTPGIPKVEGVVSRELKYMNFIEHQHEELFDLRSDPDEKHNLVSDARYADTLEKMRTRYQELKKEAGSRSNQPKAER